MGYVQDGAQCNQILSEESCVLGACPLPKLTFENASVSLSNACYEWQYAQCNGAGEITCHTCLGVSSKLQGGKMLHTLEACGNGYYRAPCMNRCVFPDAGNVRGQCVPCDNAMDLNAVYTSPGVPHTSNNCSWTCKSAYTKVAVDGRDMCADSTVV